ncbi:MAG: Hsp20/alpha crystallin family protein [Bacteroidaceae bacterium]|nr:Hsp20/alpha crystallin family protein [Bacteroidaceae bacterium]MBQ2979073.1 Hsp20/alpha crystallin family protein [Bacteroidaceae bacterium]
MTTPAKRTQNWLPGIFNDFFGNEWIAKTNASAPALNIVETEKEYIIEIAAPGVTKDDFCVTVDKHDQLIVTVENRNSNEHEKKGKYLRREFAYSQFQQTLILPENVNKDAIHASQNNGVLTITIPKNQASVAAEPKRIAIE